MDKKYKKTEAEYYVVERHDAHAEVVAQRAECIARASGEQFVVAPTTWAGERTRDLSVAGERSLRSPLHARGIDATSLRLQ